jgi:hypothetical protein
VCSQLLLAAIFDLRLGRELGTRLNRCQVALHRRHPCNLVWCVDRRSSRHFSFRVEATGQPCVDSHVQSRTQQREGGEGSDGAPAGFLTGAQLNGFDLTASHCCVDSYVQSRTQQREGGEGSDGAPAGFLIGVSLNGFNLAASHCMYSLVLYHQRNTRPLGLASFVRVNKADLDERAVRHAQRWEIGLKMLMGAVVVPTCSTYCFLHSIQCAPFYGEQREI